MICLCARKIWWEHAVAVVASRTTIEIASSICLYGKVSMTASTVSWVKWPREPNIYYDYAVLLLVSRLLHALINATCAGTRLYRTFDVGLIQLSFHISLFT